MGGGGGETTAATGETSVVIQRKIQIARLHFSLIKSADGENSFKI